MAALARRVKVKFMAILGEAGSTPTVAAAPETIQFEGREGTVLPVKVPSPSDKLPRSIFSFAIHKSGSVLLDNILLDLCAAASVPTISIDGICFAGGLRLQDLQPQAPIALLSRPGYCFYGFRGLHKFMEKVDLASCKKVILVRDPRDVLTSYFFSMKFSHTVPPAGATRAGVLDQREAAHSLSIDEYVLSPKVAFFENNFRRYMTLEGDNTKVFRYEDVIFDKRNWVAAINTWFALGVSEERVLAIADKHDIIPNQEDPNAHIRQVTPGNYKKNLTQGTVDAITRQYQDIMKHYGYA